MIPESEWNLIENTHEPIIDRETFEKVQGLVLESRRKRKQQVADRSYRQRTENILSGMVRCGICGSGVHRNGGYFRRDGSLVHYSFCCSGKYIKTKGCSSRAINETELHHSVFLACKRQLELLIDRKARTGDTLETAKSSPCLSGLKEEIRTLEDKQRKLRRKRNDLYADFKDGLVTEREYTVTRDKYRVDGEELSSRLQAAYEKIQENSRMPAAETERLRDFIPFQDAKKLTKEMCAVMVKRVVLNENSVSIHFTFTDEYEKAPAFPDGHGEECGGET